MKDLSLYIHIPFCKSKCYYCDFNSYSCKEDIQEEYIDSVIKEMERRAPILDNYRIKSIFIGGGTPTYLNLKALHKLLSYLKAYAGAGVEYSCEANPGTLTESKLISLRENGVNRLSIGLQSWNNNILEKLGRIHRVEDFIDNYKLARSIGFTNINIDLMFSIQGQTVYDFSHTLDNVIALGPDHVSCYSLIIEEGTVFWRYFQEGSLIEMDDEIDRNMYYLAVEKLNDAGFARYEISNFSRPGRECLHNIVYWKTNEYLGIGAGAHSYIEGARFSNESLPEKYIYWVQNEKLPVSWKEELSHKDKVSEFMFMGLRMTEGVSLEEFQKRFGSELSKVYHNEVRGLAQNGLIVIKDGRLMLTDKGIDLSNQVFAEFLL